MLVPLGLGLAFRPDAGPTAETLLRLRLAAGPAAALAALAFLPGRGLLAALLTLPWLAVGATAGVIGVGRFLSRRRLDPTIGIDAALVFLTVGAGWLTISRAGANPLGFSDAIVQLTAVHFHYAGFALPLVAGLAARQTARGSLVRLSVIVGVPLTAAASITAGGTLEWVAATVMVDPVRLDLPRARPDGPLAWNAQRRRLRLRLRRTHRPPPHTVHRGTRRADCHRGRPSDATLATIASLAHDTGPLGILSRPVPDGYRHDQWDLPLPNGFQTARTALRKWVGHRAAGIIIADPPPIAVGETVSMSLPVGPISVTATARIIHVVDEPDRYGFTFATLPHHPEDGEESFIITRPADGPAHYTVTAVWRAGT